MNIESFNENNIVFDRLVPFDDVPDGKEQDINIKKFDVYYNDNEDYQKIQFTINKAKITTSILNNYKKSKNVVRINLSVGPKKDKNLLLLNAMKAIENKIKEYVWKKISKKLVFRKNLSDDHDFSFALRIKLPIVKTNDNNPEFNFPIYDNNNNKTFGYHLTKDSIVNMTIILKEVLIGSSQFGCNWEAVNATIIESDNYHTENRTQFYPNKEQLSTIPNWIIDLLKTKLEVEKNHYKIHDSSQQSDQINKVEKEDITLSLAYRGGENKIKNIDVQSPVKRNGFIPCLADIEKAKKNLKKINNNHL